MLLFVTPAGLEAIGVEPEATEGTDAHPAAPESDSATERPGHAGSVETGHGDHAKAGEAPHAPHSAAQAGETAPKACPGTKQARLIEMLRRPEGASIEEIVAAAGWQPHTARGAIAGALKKKLGLEVSAARSAPGRAARKGWSGHGRGALRPRKRYRRSQNSWKPCGRPLAASVVGPLREAGGRWTLLVREFGPEF